MNELYEYNCIICGRPFKTRKKDMPVCTDHFAYWLEMKRRRKRYDNSGRQGDRDYRFYES
jgi:DNA-directed RNA polymerase subunit RPC12/RpoP